MILPVPTACALSCDNCNREFQIGSRHVFKSTAQALTWAEQQGWTINGNKALCPECQNLTNLNHGNQS